MTDPKLPQTEVIPKPEEAEQCKCTSGNCLTLDCLCFRHGKLCESTCTNPNCENNEKHAEKRLAAMEELLSSNPMAFTGEDTLNQDECAAICNFAMLTTSVDAEKFRVTKKEYLNKKMPDIIHQAIKTVMSSVNEDLNCSTAETFEEKTENSIAQEFNFVLNTILQHLKKQP